MANIIREIDGDQFDPAGNTPAMEAAATLLEHLAAVWPTLPESLQQQIMAANPQYASAVLRIKAAVERVFA